MDHHSSITPPRRRVRWKLAIPMFLALAGTLLLVGCIYLPIPEHTVNHQQKDFRPLIGTDEKPGQIREGTSRREVVRLLGETTYKLHGGRTAVYFLDTEQGFFVGVTCFGPQQSVYALVLRYDDGKVTKIDQGQEGGAGGLLQMRYEPFTSLHDDYIQWRLQEAPIPTK